MFSSKTSSRDSILLCLYLNVGPRASLEESTILAWFSLSKMRQSFGPHTADMEPRFVCIPVLKIKAASWPKYLASFSSNSSCMDKLPFKNLEPVQPVP